MIGVLMVILFIFVFFITNEANQKSKARQNTQLEYIKNYQFHRAIKIKLKNKHPLLTDEQLELVFEGLRDYFTICNQANGEFISMPSQVIDDAWHEFILFTNAYELFCNQAFSRFLHHTPAEAMRTTYSIQNGIKHAWRLSCTKEGINVKEPSRLPRLFAMDSLLAITGGFIYSLDCNALTASNEKFCVSSIGCGGCAGGGCGGCGG